MVKGLGASMCFDHSDPTLVDEVVTYLNGKEVAEAYDASSHVSMLNAICEIIEENLTLTVSSRGFRFRDC